jgi:hypothetical protein
MFRGNNCRVSLLRLFLQKKKTFHYVLPDFLTKTQIIMKCEWIWLGLLDYSIINIFKINSQIWFFNLFLIFFSETDVRTNKTLTFAISRAASQHYSASREARGLLLLACSWLAARRPQCYKFSSFGR